VKGTLKTLLYNIFPQQFPMVADLCHVAVSLHGTTVENVKKIKKNKVMTFSYFCSSF
jgi:hypothetical protein